MASTSLENDFSSRSAPAEADKTQTSEKSRTRLSGLTLSRVGLITLVGTLLFVASHLFVWWELELVAPQFPGGLYIQSTSYEIQDSPKTAFSDIREVDGLNHYIGMMSLGDAAQVEMAVAIPAVIIFTILGLAAVVWRNKWAPLLTIPIILFPWVFWADLQFWLWYAGNNLDPTAAITLEPFTPPAIGTGTIAQFSTVAAFQPGWYVAVAAGVLCVISIILSLRRKSDV